MGIRIVTDSSCDLPAEFIERHNIEIVPLTVRVSGKEYTEGVSITPAEFAVEMSSSTELPKTSQPTPQVFLEAFGKAVQSAGAAAEVLCITLSSKLSGTFQSALIAQRMHEGKVMVVDSLSGSLGLGLMVLEAHRLSETGAKIHEIRDYLHELREKMTVLVGLDTLENAVKGGRIKKVQSAVAQILRLKFFVHTVEGRVEVCGRARGKAGIIATFLDSMAAKGVDFHDRLVGIAHVANLADAEKLAEAIRERFAPKEIITVPMGSTIATYAGIGALLLAY